MVYEAYTETVMYVIKSLDFLIRSICGNVIRINCTY